MPTPSRQSAPLPQHGGGFITGRQAVQPAQNVSPPSMPQRTTSMQDAAHQGVPVPSALVHPGSLKPPAPGQGAPPVPYQHMHATGYGPSPGMPQQTGIPIPRAVGINMVPAMAHAAQPMLTPGRAPQFAPQPYGPSQAGRGATGPPYRYGEQVSRPAISGSLLKTLTIVLLAFLGVIGAYFVVGQLILPSLSQPSGQTAAVPQQVGGQAPEILNLAVASITETSAVIKWQTDKPTTSQILIRDSDGTRTQNEPGAELSKDHRLTLSGLTAGTTYQYTVISKDAAGNESRKDGELTTLSQADSIPPVIAEVPTASVTETSVTITWTTDEAATSQVEYGKTSTYGTKTPLDETLTTNHRVVITGLAANTQYHFIAKSADANGNEAVSQDNLFRTTVPIPVGPSVGNRAPPFTLPDIDGNSVSLNDFAGKIVIVNFWAEWCVPCKEELPYFQGIYDTWSPDELVILAIDVGDSPTVVSDYLEAEGFTFPVLLDTSGSTNSDYIVSSDQKGIPRTFFIDEQGIVRHYQYGAFPTQADLEGILNML